MTSHFWTVAPSPSDILLMKHRPRTALVLGGLALSACAERGTLRLDGRAASHSSAPAIGSVRAGLTLGGGRLVIDRARIAVSEIELEGGSEDDELEAEMGGAVIDIELGGKPTTITVGEVEAGTYHTLGLEFTQANFEGHTARRRRCPRRQCSPYGLRSWPG